MTKPIGVLFEFAVPVLSLEPSTSLFRIEEYE